MKLTVEGIPGLDGEYVEGGMDTISNTEFHEIKKETGLRAGEMQEAFNAGDTDAVIAIAWVVLSRAGKQGVWPLLWKSDITKLTFDFTDEETEEEEVPLVSLPPSEPTGSESDSSETGRSSPTLNGVSESPASVPSPIGLPPSRTGSTSAPETLAR